MRKTVSFLNRFWGYQSGAVAAEYAIVLAAVAVVVAVAMVVLDGALTGVLQDAADCAEDGCV